MSDVELIWELQKDLNKELYEQMTIEFKPTIELEEIALDI